MCEVLVSIHLIVHCGWSDSQRCGARQWHSAIWEVFLNRVNHIRPGIANRTPVEQLPSSPQDHVSHHNHPSHVFPLLDEGYPHQAGLHLRLVS